MKFLDALPIRVRVFVPLIVVGLGLIAMSGIEAYRTAALVESERRDRMRVAVELATGVLEAAHQRAASGKVSESVAREDALDTIRRMRFDKEEYYFVFNAQLINVAHGANKAIEGRNMAETADPNGVKFIRDMASAAASGGGFVRYVFAKPGFADPVPKIGMMQKFEPWGLYVGSGVYADDVQRAFISSVVGLAIATGLVLMLGAAAAFWLGKSFVTPFSRVSTRIMELALGETSKPVPHVDAKHEIGELARSVEVFRKTTLKAEEARAAEERASELQRRRASDVEQSISEFRDAVSMVLGAVGAHADQGKAAARALSQAAGMADSEAGCGFRFIPAGYSDLKPATVPI